MVADVFAQGGQEKHRVSIQGWLCAAPFSVGRVMAGLGGKAPLEWAGGGEPVTLSSPKPWTQPPASRDWQGVPGVLICPHALSVGAAGPSSN